LVTLGVLGRRARGAAGHASGAAGARPARAPIRGSARLRPSGRRRERHWVRADGITPQLTIEPPRAPAQGTAVFPWTSGDRHWRRQCAARSPVGPTARTVTG